VDALCLGMMTYGSKKWRIMPNKKRPSFCFAVVWRRGISDRGRPVYRIFSSGNELERIATKQGERTMSMKTEATRKVCMIGLQ